MEDQYIASDYPSTVDPALAGVIMITYLVILVAAYAIGAFLLGRIFKKAGVEQWKAWVPFYNNWITYELGDQKGWISLLLLVPLANIVALVYYFIALYHIGLKLQKEGWFVLLAIFVPLVWFIWLAFDKSTWQGNSAAVSGTPTFQPPVASDTNEPPAPTPPQNLVQ